MYVKKDGYRANLATSRWYTDYSSSKILIEYAEDFSITFEFESPEDRDAALIEIDEAICAGSVFLDLDITKVDYEE